MRGGLLRRSLRLLKKAGKPMEVPPRKQVYLPYETEPTSAELAAARKQFSKQPSWQLSLDGKTKIIEVKEVPENMYTYGKEGMSVPIAIFKDQKDPVIAPEHTYPGIYENKIAGKMAGLDRLFEMEKNDSFESPWQKNMLDNAVNAKIGLAAWRMKLLRINGRHKFLRDRGGRGKKKPGK